MVLTLQSHSPSGGCNLTTKAVDDRQSWECEDHLRGHIQASSGFVETDDSSYESDYRGAYSLRKPH